MYNIKKAVSRLEFAPKIDEIKITDIQHGIGVFSPKADKAVSFGILKDTLKKAGYTLASAEIVVAGVLGRDESGWWIISDKSNQRFTLEGANLKETVGRMTPGTRAEIAGDWQTTGEGSRSREVVRPRTSQRAAVSVDTSIYLASFIQGRESSGFSDKIELLADSETKASLSLTPIRTTSPGLTVYKGGAIVARYSFTRQHLGNLRVERQGIRLNASYTPTPRIQVEAEIPYQRTSFKTGASAGSGHGFGNLVLWGKYRFFRTLETWGDRQAAMRFGLELPTGKKDGPRTQKLPASAFIRQQLTPIAGGLSAHVDGSYSQAKGRFVYGANLEGIVRSERAGFRLGNEVRVNTDLEYVALPRKYRSPTHELFLIFETTYLYRGRGRIGGAEAPGSSSSEFYVAPALQYTASQRFLIEGSYQIPVVMNTGPQHLRTDRNLLVGFRYLY